MNKAWIPEGLEVYPDARRLVLLGVDLIVHNATSFSDGLTCFDVLCGENGWWVSVAFNMSEKDFYAYPPEGDPLSAVEGAEQIVDLIVELSCRTRPVPFLEYGPHNNGLEGLWWGSFDKWEWS